MPCCFSIIMLSLSEGGGHGQWGMNNGYGSQGRGGFGNQGRGGFGNQGRGRPSMGGGRMGEHTVVFLTFCLLRLLSLSF